MPRIWACKCRRTFVHLISRTAAQVVVAKRQLQQRATDLEKNISLDEDNGRTNF